jgi:RimJ/RimL family protein N-acetyltransferase
MIHGNLVALRPVEQGDYLLIHRWMNHPDVWRYMDYETPVSLADVQEDVERSYGEGHPFTIVVGDRPIGRIGLNQFRRRDRICSLYMYLGEPEFAGRGYARDAVMALLEFAFSRWDLHQVELWTLADNTRAISTYSHCGFVPEATLRERSWKQGEWVDRIIMGVTRDEFSKAAEEWRSSVSTP